MPDPERDRDLIRRRLLGWGLACEPIAPGAGLGRDLRVANGDLARVAGFDNLGQSLAIALTTLLGSDVFNTRFGFGGLNALVEETNAVIARERIRVGVIQVLRNEPRIRRIVDVNLADGRLTSRSAAGDDSGGADIVGGDPASLLRSRSLSVRVAFETVSGDQATVNLGTLDLGGVPSTAAGEPPVTVV